jgi:hypothetical protein
VVSTPVGTDAIRAVGATSVSVRRSVSETVIVRSAAAHAAASHRRSFRHSTSSTVLCTSRRSSAASRCQIRYSDVVLEQDDRDWIGLRKVRGGNQKVGDTKIELLLGKKLLNLFADCRQPPLPQINGIAREPRTRQRAYERR